MFFPTKQNAVNTIPTVLLQITAHHLPQIRMAHMAGGSREHGSGTGTETRGMPKRRTILTMRSTNGSITAETSKVRIRIPTITERQKSRKRGQKTSFSFCKNWQFCSSVYGRSRFPG